MAFKSTLAFVPASFDKVRHHVSIFGADGGESSGFKTTKPNTFLVVLCDQRNGISDGPNRKPVDVTKFSD